MTDNTIVNALSEMNVTMSFERRNGRTGAAASDWDSSASHWNVSLSRDSHKTTFQYSMGSAHTGNPQIEDIMHCCLMDASIAEDHENAADMAECFGMETETEDERKKVMQVWSACVKMRARMKIMFTDTELEKLHEVFEDF